jgi:hypothetical protein
VKLYRKQIKKYSNTVIKCPISHNESEFKSSKKKTTTNKKIIALEKLKKNSYKKTF